MNGLFYAASRIGEPEVKRRQSRRAPHPTFLLGSSFATLRFSPTKRSSGGILAKAGRSKEAGPRWQPRRPPAPSSRVYPRRGKEAAVGRVPGLAGNAGIYYKGFPFASRFSRFAFAPGSVPGALSVEGAARPLPLPSAAPCKLTQAQPVRFLQDDLRHSGFGQGSPGRLGAADPAARFSLSSAVLTPTGKPIASGCRGQPCRKASPPLPPTGAHWERKRRQKGRLGLGAGCLRGAAPSAAGCSLGKRRLNQAACLGWKTEEICRGRQG